MKLQYHIIELTFLLGGIITLSSCHTDALSYGEDSPVTVSFDWSDAPDARPEGMRVTFHPLDITSRQAVLRYDYPGRGGGQTSLQPGKYVVFTYNNDSDAIGFDSPDDWRNAKARTGDANVTDPMGFTRAGATSFRPVAGEPVRKCPDKMWGASADTLYVDYSGKPKFITLKPEPLFCEYDYTITNVKNLDKVKYMSAAISGMSDGVNMYHQENSAIPCTHPIPAQRKDSTTITGRFTVFGTMPNDSVRHFMELYAVTADGKQYRIHGDPGSAWDVTSQVRNAPDPRHVSLKIDNVEIPDSTVQTGMLPGFEDWEEIHIVVPL